MVFSPNGKSWITWGLVIPMKIQELVDLCGWNEQLCLGCPWWWNAYPVKQWMLSCSTEPVPIKIRYPFLQSLKSDLVCHYRKNLSPGVSSARITITLWQSILEYVIHILILAFTVSGELSIQRWNKNMPQLFWLFGCNFLQDSTYCLLCLAKMATTRSFARFMKQLQYAWLG